MIAIKAVTLMGSHLTSCGIPGSKIKSTPESSFRVGCIYMCQLKKIYILLCIYILNVAALDETIVPSCLHFSMQNIEQSRGLGRASRWSNVNVNQ